MGLQTSARRTRVSSFWLVCPLLPPGSRNLDEMRCGELWWATRSSWRRGCACGCCFHGHLLRSVTIKIMPNMVPTSESGLEVWTAKGSAVNGCYTLLCYCTSLPLGDPFSHQTWQGEQSPSNLRVLNQLIAAIFLTRTNAIFKCLYEKDYIY